MTLWHQRLIIFLSKIFGAILLILLFCLFLYYDYYFKKDVFLKYTPQNTLFYASFNLNNKDLNNSPIFNNFIREIEQDYNFITLPLENLNPYINYNAALAVIPEQDNSLAYLIMYNLNDKKLDNYLSRLDKNNWHYIILKNQVLERNILVISNSQNVLATVKLTALKEKPSLSQKISTVLDLKSFDHDCLGKIYINSKAVLVKLNQDSSNQLKFLSFVLKDNLNDDLYLGLKTIDQKIIIASKEINSEEENTNLGNDFASDNLAILGLDQSQQVLTQVLNNLKQYDLAQFNSFNQNLNYWQKLYNFDWQNDLLPFLNGRTTLILKPDNKVLVILKPIQAINAEQLDKLKQVIINYLATKNPVESEKIMPDFSKITQIIRQPNQYIFEKISVKNVDLYDLNSAGQEICLAQMDNYIILANNKQILQEFVSQEDLENVLINIGSANFSQNLYLSDQIIEQLKIPITKRFQFSQTENNRFLLILE